MKKVKKSVEIEGRKLILEAGELQTQADGAAVATYGETVVLATVVSSVLTEDRGYFPLTVEYREKLYSGGRIKGSRWVKREGRPSDEEILTARLIDRSIRPLFPKDYNKEVQVIITVLSVDLQNSPDVVAACATSAALAASSIPWNGPMSMLKVGLVDNKLKTNPLDAELEKSDLELLVSFAGDSVVMIESGSNEVPEEKITEAISHAQKDAKKMSKLISDFAKEFSVTKQKVEKPKKNASLEKKVKQLTK